MRVVFINPSKLNIILNKTAYATSEVTAGKNIPVLKMPRNLILLSLRIAASTNAKKALLVLVLLKR